MPLSGQGNAANVSLVGGVIVLDDVVHRHFEIRM